MPLSISDKYWKCIFTDGFSRITRSEIAPKGVMTSWARENGHGSCISVQLLPPEAVKNYIEQLKEGEERERLEASTRQVRKYQKKSKDNIDRINSELAQLPVKEPSFNELRNEKEGAKNDYTVAEIQGEKQIENLDEELVLLLEAAIESENLAGLQLLEFREWIVKKGPIYNSKLLKMFVEHNIEETLGELMIRLDKIKVNLDS